MTRSRRPSEFAAVGGDGVPYSLWREHTQINLSPVAAPSILGLFGFAVSTFMVAKMTGWFGDDVTTPLILAPLAITVGGVAEFLAAMWSYRSRDTLATAIHGTWGAFWIAYGIYRLLAGLGGLPGTAASPVAATAFGFWFVGLAAVMWIGVFAAAAENAGVILVLLALAVGGTLMAIGLIAGVSILETIAAYCLLASAVLAWYIGSAMVLEAAYGRVVLPMGKRSPPNVPGRQAKGTTQFDLGERGRKVGQ